MLMFILGFCTMSVFAFFALFFLDKGKEEVAFFCCGPVMWFWVVVVGGCAKLIQKIKLHFFRKNYVAMSLYFKKELWDTTYVHKKAVHLFKTKEDAGEDGKYWTEVARDCIKAKSLPPKRFIIGKMVRLKQEKKHTLVTTGERGTKFPLFRRQTSKSQRINR